MNTNNFRFHIVNIPLLLLSIGATSLTQADSDYPMMGRADHRSMMGYGYGQSRYTKEDESHEAMPYGYRGGMGRIGCDQTGSGMMRYGGHMGSGMRSGTWAIMQLDLSDTQKQKVREIHRQHRRENWNRMGEMMEHQDKLEELYDADTLDPKAIGEIYAAIFEIKRKKIETSIQAQNKTRALLTKKQQEALNEELKNTRHYKHGYGHMR